MYIMKISKTKFNKYKILRSLYIGCKTYEELLSETWLEPTQLNTALSRLLSYGDIKKRKITAEEPITLDEKRIQAHILDIPIKTKTKYHNEYELTRKGMNKLAFFEVKYRCFEKWCPYSEEGIWHDNYIRNIAKHIRKKNIRCGGQK
jgi:hypothetical protein